MMRLPPSPASYGSSGEYEAAMERWLKQRERDGWWDIAPILDDRMESDEKEDC